MSLVATLRQTACSHPEKTAIVCRDRAVSYGQLDRRVRGLAQWLLQEGLRPGDRVSLHWNNEIETVEILLACFHAGLITVPINVRFKAAEVAYVLNHSRPAMCFSSPALAPVDEAARAGDPHLPAIRTTLPDTPDAAVDAMPAPGHPAIVMYTSGTTAQPKGVTHTHASLLAGARAMWATGLDAAASMVIAVPLMHASGLTVSTLPGLLAGATVVLIPAFDAGAVLDAIERHRCNWGLGLPAMMQLLAAEQERQPRDVSCLHTWLAGGDAVPLALQHRFQRLFGCPLREAYAMTENAIITCNPASAIRAGSMGRPAYGVQARVLNSQGRDVAYGVTGELVVRSPANFSGYWNNPEATAAALVDGWLFTGDLVHRDAEGYLWFDGRHKEIIVRGGSNISPQEVEEAVYRHPAVMEVGVIGVPDAVYGEEVVACVSLRPGRSATSEELIHHARQLLADYKVPSRVVFLDQLPKGPTGKVQRRALKETVG